MLTCADGVQEAVSDGNAARESLGKQVLQVFLCVYLCLRSSSVSIYRLLIPAAAAAAGGVPAGGGEYES